MTYIASSILGAFAAAAFIGLLVPQVYWNYIRRSTEGMSPSMIALWIVAGVLYVAYLHSFSQPNVALLVQWHSVNFLCCVIAGQWYRYRNRRPPPRLFSGQASNTPAPLRLSTPRLSASVTPTKEEKVILKLPAADRSRASTRAQALFRHSVSQQQPPATAAAPTPAAAAPTTPNGTPVTPRLAAGSDGRGGAGAAPTPMIVTIDHTLADPALARNSAYTVGGTLRPLPPLWHGALFGASWCAAYVIVFLGAWQIFEQCKGVNGADWIPWVGGSIIPAIMLAIGFVPQVTLIIRVKSSEGFSRLLALVDLCGAALSIIAIGVDNTSSVEYKQMIPYFVICGCQLFMFVLTTCIYPPLVIIDDLKGVGVHTSVPLAELPAATSGGDNSKATSAAVTASGPVVSFFDAPAGGGPRKSVTDTSSAAAAAPAQPASLPVPSSDNNPTIDTSSQPIPAGAPLPPTSPSTTAPSVSMEPVVPPEAASALLLSVSLPSSDGSSDGHQRVDSAAVTNVEPDSVLLTVV